MTRPKMTSLQTIWQLELVLGRLSDEIIFVAEETDRLFKRPWADRINSTEKATIHNMLSCASSDLSFTAGFVSGLRSRLKEEREHERSKTLTETFE